MNGASSREEWRASQFPPGSDKTVACVKRSEKMDRSFKSGTLNSGGPETVPEGVERRPKAIDVRPTEDGDWSLRESDPPIVVRDGNAGHKAKEWAGRQRKQSTYDGTRLLPAIVSSSLLALGTDSDILCPDRFHLRVFLRSPVR